MRSKWITVLMLGAAVAVYHIAPLAADPPAAVPVAQATPEPAQTGSSAAEELSAEAKAYVADLKAEFDAVIAKAAARKVTHDEFLTKVRGIRTKLRSAADNKTIRYGGPAAPRQNCDRQDRALERCLAPFENKERMSIRYSDCEDTCTEQNTSCRKRVRDEHKNRPNRLERELQACEDRQENCNSRCYERFTSDGACASQTSERKTCNSARDAAQSTWSRATQWCAEQKCGGHQGDRCFNCLFTDEERAGVTWLTAHIKGEVSRVQVGLAGYSPIEPTFVRIPAGSWTRDGQPVTITRSFMLQATEVTQKEWRGLMGSNPSHFERCGNNCPVENVSWWDSLAYMNALSADQGLQQCYDLSGCTGTPGTGDYTCPGWTASRFVGLSCTGFRLPTEAEWEYAARAGTTGERYGALDDVAWHSGNSGRTTKPVGQKLPNAFGLHDMLGNVWEWTWDWLASYPSTAVTDPLGPDTGSYRVRRGGSWDGGADFAVAAFRFSYGFPTFRNGDLGFRPARSF